VSDDLHVNAVSVLGELVRLQKSYESTSGNIGGWRAYHIKNFRGVDSHADHLALSTINKHLRRLYDLGYVERPVLDVAAYVPTDAGREFYRIRTGGRPRRDQG
jgi:DNA-binding transcriptional ArsR family regulator